jgi:hypothetical protein
VSDYLVVTKKNPTEEYKEVFNDTINARQKDIIDRLNYWFEFGDIYKADWAKVQKK